jgi:hypothetical protein
VPNIRLLPREILLRHLVPHYSMWTPILEINCSIKCLGPKKTWQPLIMQHGSHSPNYGPVLPLSNPILLWVVRKNQISRDALSYTKVNKILGGILTPIVCPRNSDFPPSLVLHKIFELLELIEDLSFGLHEENPRLSREVINEYGIV